MDEEVETLLVGVRADTGAFAADAAAMRASLEQSLGGGADRAGRLIESGLARAIRSGKLGFDDLERTALAALGAIASHAIAGGLSAATGGDGGLVSLGTRLIGAALGLPGRATGGPVSPGRAYLVGERGPEMFVPTSSGNIAAPQAGGARDVRVAITLVSPGGDQPQALARSGRQVARAVSDALARAER
ncbi:tail tape measure protein [Sphingomonas sp.]|uniref:tail tape measure protein n=1 Tax=Sphingomonas sp. TaxID=28214 RepID=UPI003B00D02D